MGPACKMFSERVHQTFLLFRHLLYFYLHYLCIQTHWHTSLFSFFKFIYQRFLLLDKVKIQEHLFFLTMILLLFFF